MPSDYVTVVIMMIRDDTQDDFENFDFLTL